MDYERGGLMMHLTGKLNDGPTGFPQKLRVTGPHRARRTWIMVADRNAARLFQKGKKGLELIGVATPGEAAEKGAGGLVANRAFSRQISDWLDRALWKDSFDRLVLIAAPQTLDELRKTLKYQVRARTVAEIGSDLPALDNQELHAALVKMIWF